MEKKYHYTYRLVFQNGIEYYEGVRSTNVRPEDDIYFGSGTEIRRRRKLYGNGCFSKQIVGIWPSREEALFQEKLLVGDKWKTDPNCLNSCPGGQKSGKFDVSGYIWIHKGSFEKRVPEENFKLFEEHGWEKGLSLEHKKSRDETKAARGFGKPWLGKHLPEEAKRKISNSLKGRKPWNKGKPGTMKGKHHSEETRQKMREAKQGLCWITNGTVNKRVPVQNLEQYIQNGFYKGRII